jgi:hypothetical protein
MAAVVMAYAIKLFSQFSLQVNHRTVINGQWAMGNGQWAMINDQSPMINPQSFVHRTLRIDHPLCIVFT